LFVGAPGPPAVGRLNKGKAMKKKYIIVIVLFLNTISIFSQGYESYTYKTIESLSLNLLVKRPDNNLKNNPVIIFFHGGSYIEGDPSQFMDFYEYFTKRGFVTIGPRYRFLNNRAHLIDDIFNDAVDAVNWVIDNGSLLKINTDDIYLCGYSAGAHLVLSTVMNAPNNNLRKTPKGLVLIAAPVKTMFKLGQIDLRKLIPNGIYFSPYYKIKANLPPMLFLQGTDDKEVSSTDVVNFVKKMKEKKNNCQIKMYEKRGHHLFNSSNDLNDIFATMTTFINGI
jgi:acetyl esterase/lipase